MLICKPSLNSESVFQCELNDARIIGGRGDDTEGRTGADAAIWIAEIGSVGQVEELRPHVNAVGLCDRKCAFESHIDVALSWTADQADSAVSEDCI